MRDRTEQFLATLDGQPVIPVVRIDHLADAVPLARALARGGLPAIEITLRTPPAIDAIRLVAAEVADAVVGAGTVLSAKDFHACLKAGARFVVSPGMTQELLDVAAAGSVPFLPGAATPSEIMAAREEGYRMLKFFPAEPSGGVAFLKAIAGPLADMRFCPTGGVSAGNAADYLALPNVACVGGSWVVPDDAIQGGDWERVEELARGARKLATV